MVTIHEMLYLNVHSLKSVSVVGMIPVHLSCAYHLHGQSVTRKIFYS